jgi:hypothetical protein
MQQLKTRHVPIHSKTAFGLGRSTWNWRSNHSVLGGSYLSTIRIDANFFIRDRSFWKQQILKTNYANDKKLFLKTEIEVSANDSTKGRI